MEEITKTRKSKDFSQAWRRYRRLAPAIFKFPKDSAGLKKHMRQLVVVAYQAHSVDSVLKQASGNILSLLNDVNLTIFKLQSSLYEIAHVQNELADNLLQTP